MSSIPASHVDILASTAIATIATIGPGGKPQNTPVWFAWDGSHIKLSLLKTAQKYRNIQREPHVALAIVDPHNAYRYLEIRGRVIWVDKDTDRSFVNSLTWKYLKQEIYPWHNPGDEHMIIVIEPLHVNCLG